MSYLGLTNIEPLRKVTMHEIAGSDNVYFRNPDNTIVSIQPDGKEETRPSDSIPAAYETATIIGPNLVMFTPDGNNSYVRYFTE